jgi:virulence factor Mce-like protein
VKRALVIGLVVAFVAGGVLTSLGAGGSAGGRRYDIVFDNAFGLVKGADFKVGGVAVGTITGLDVQRKDARALVSVSVTKDRGFGALRSDAHCTVAPQSLIGEYFVDCQPGAKGRVLRSGATIPVANTESPIPPDLVLDVMRMPVRERFSLVLGELGAGLAARGDDLNATIKRAIPAIGSTDKVLGILDANKRTLADLSRNSGTVLKVLGQRHADVGRFVVNAEDAARATADRRGELADTFRRLPGFLDQLTPTMAALGTAAREQTPALADLRAASGSVDSLLDTLRPFSKALEPATTTLGAAGTHGSTAAEASRALIGRLGKLGATIGEPAKNLAIIGSDLDDRSRAVEPDPDSSGGKGYTGLEAPLQYVFDQSLAVNIFDQRGYALKLDVLADQCAGYTTADDARRDEARYRKCSQALGPNQPGITTPDPSPPMTAVRSERSSSKERNAKKPGKAGKDQRPAAGGDAPASSGEPAPSGGDTSPSPTAGPNAPDLPPVQQLLDQLPHLLDPLKPVLGGGGSTEKSATPTPTPTPSGQSAQDLLDFLLSP